MNNIQAKQKIDYTAWAVKIADSEMKHNPELWMADFVKPPNGIIRRVWLPKP